MSANILSAHVQAQLDRLTAADMKRLSGILDDVSRCVEATAAFIDAGNFKDLAIEQTWLPAIRGLPALLKQMEALVEVHPVFHAIVQQGPQGAGLGLGPEAWREDVKERTELARKQIDSLREALGAGATDEALSVIWYHGEKSYSIDGRTPVNVSQEQHNILKAFRDNTIALDTQSLSNTGVNNVTDVIRKLVKKFGEDAIRRPKNKGDGYFLRVRSLKTTN
jgi:hypothetical protein